MSNAIMSIQVIPTVKAEEHPYDYVDLAIACIAESGLAYEVHALDTTVEGELSQLLPLLNTINQRLVKKGAISVMLQVKTFYKPIGIQSAELLEKYS